MFVFLCRTYSDESPVSCYLPKSIIARTAVLGIENRPQVAFLPLVSLGPWHDQAAPAAETIQDQADHTRTGQGTGCRSQAGDLIVYQLLIVIFYLRHDDSLFFLLLKNDYEISKRQRGDACNGMPCIHAYFCYYIIDHHYSIFDYPSSHLKDLLFIISFKQQQTPCRLLLLLCPPAVAASWPLRPRSFAS